MQFVMKGEDLSRALDEFRRYGIDGLLRVELRDGIVILDGVSGGSPNCGSGCGAAARHLRIRIKPEASGRRAGAQAGGDPPPPPGLPSP